MKLIATKILLLATAVFLYSCSDKKSNSLYEESIPKELFKDVNLDDVEPIKDDEVLYTGDSEEKVLKSVKYFKNQDNNFSLQSVQFYAPDLQDTVTEYDLNYNNKLKSQMSVVNRKLISMIMPVARIHNNNVEKIVKKLTSERTPVKRVKKGVFKDTSADSNEYTTFLLAKEQGSDSTTIVAVTWPDANGYELYFATVAKMLNGTNSKNNKRIDLKAIQ